MKRIALLTATLSPASGGLAASVPSMAMHLDRLEGTEVHVVGTEDPGDPGAANNWGTRVHAHRVVGPASFRFAPGLGRSLSDLAPDLIDVQGLWTYPSLASLRNNRRTGIPYVVTPRGMLDPWARDRSRWKKRLVRLCFEDAHLHGASCLRATAEMEAEHFRTFGLRQPIAIVPNGVDTPPLQPFRPAADAPRRLLFLSRIHPKKGLAYLIRAWAALEPLYPNWELVIAGPDEVGHAREMLNLATSLKLQSVHWMGSVNGEGKKALYRSSDLFVLPTHAENFGLVVAEALAHGVPVVTTHNAPWAGLRDNRCGWWVELAHDSLLSALREAMALPAEERHVMGARGHAWMARDFGWESIARQMLEVYRWVAGDTDRPACIEVG